MVLSLTLTAYVDALLGEKLRDVAQELHDSASSNYQSSRKTKNLTAPLYLLFPITHLYLSQQCMNNYHSCWPSLMLGVLLQMISFKFRR